MQALTDVDLDVRAGEVTALLGDNGAGKSVLVKMHRGHPRPDHGEIEWEGRPVRIRTPRDAAALGIETVYQDLALCNNLDIVQNMFLGRERKNGFVLDEEQMETAAQETLASLAVTTVRSIRQPVASLSGGQRQSVAIAKSVLWNPKLVIMDEPTAALGVAQTKMVLDAHPPAGRPGARGPLISHNMNDVFEVADRIAVLLPRPHGRGPTDVGARPSARVDLMTTGTSSRLPPRRRRTAAGPSVSKVDEPTGAGARRRGADGGRRAPGRAGGPAELVAGSAASTCARRSPGSRRGDAASCRWSAG